MELNIFQPDTIEPNTLILTYNLHRTNVDDAFQTKQGIVVAAVNVVGVEPTANGTRLGTRAKVRLVGARIRKRR